MKKLLITLLVLSFSAIIAEPYMATRTGYKCSQCHVNRTGGGKRTSFGFAYTQTQMPVFQIKPKGTSSSFSNIISDHLSVGANFRVANKTILGTDSTRNLVGQDADMRMNNSITIPEANIYLEISAIPDLLLFYVDENFAPGAASREAFAMIYNLPLNSYIKFGRIMMPFGLRLLDDGTDGAYIRSKTGFNSYGRQEAAYEIGIEPGPFSLITAVANGLNSESMDKQITTVGSVVFRRIRIGGSYSFNKGKEYTEHVAGIFAGGNQGVFTWMFEHDFINKIDSEGNPISNYGDFDLTGNLTATFASLDILLYSGVNLKIAYDKFDPMSKWKSDELDRWTFGLEIFPVQFLQVSAFYRYRTAPSLEIYNSENEDQIFIETQFFF
ncbi:MAG: hypothetical protein QF847_01350 [Candidatus Marinimicrobia bacterium]|jgi:hypothetical protein|nr:hypothetical protein [Candidatus Neomarinimicrobiota bacterium]MDP6499418.1 hypothetical protein [Candidatus Neomarinimicrobiota bacterium]MDP6725880.1 hypothetical protein [Candidatus Neomarinimicrobiota bacterium]|tara:strand:- start:382 stop:1530 length:1149 start_codon:yes stop_codon:yes gene_type:complete